MREFKFIRGKYTDENIFNTDETNNCLFAYDSEGNLVQFIEKNNKDFQDKFARLSSDRLSEIYTFRPSQFKISAQKESAGHYSFNFKADEDVYDGSRQFPADVIKNAETRIKAKTEAEFDTTSKLPLLNLNGNAERQTLTTFKFNNDKTFTRNLVFKVSGHLNERGYTVAQDAVDAAFPVSGGKINYAENESNKVSGIFNNGKKQSETPFETRSVAPASLTLSKSNTAIGVASTYNAPKGFAILDTQFKSSVGFSDQLKTINLYKEYDKYYVSATDGGAVNAITQFVGTGNKFKLNESLYQIDNNPSISENYYYIEDVSSVSNNDVIVKSVSDAATYSLLGDSDTLVKSGASSSLGFNIIPNNKTFSATEAVAFNSASKSITLGENKVAFCRVGSRYVKCDAGTNFSIRYSGIDSEGGVVNVITTVAEKWTITGHTIIITNSEDEVTDVVVYDISNPDCYVTIGNPTAIQPIYKAVPVKKQTTYSLNTGYVAVANETPTVAVKAEDHTDKVFISDASIKLRNNATIDNPNNYEYYLQYNAKSYSLNSSIAVQSRDNLLVKGYAESYNGLYVFENKSLRSVVDNDLTADGTLNVYTSKDHNIVNSGVYDNDAKDTKDYVMFSDEWRQTAINSKNASVRDSDNMISPIITEDTLRLLTDDIVVNATQSD